MSGNDEVAREFGENLKRCREQATVSQEELAVWAGLHRTEISQLERAQRVPRIDTLIKLATSLGVSADALLEGITWNPGTMDLGQFRVQGEGQDTP
jgi:transcriptional regulator with XRE-family HTH domain